LLALIRLRNAHAAFAGSFRLLDSDAATLGLRWDHGAEFAELRVNLATADYELTHSSAAGAVHFSFTSSPPQPDYAR